MEFLVVDTVCGGATSGEVIDLNLDLECGQKNTSPRGDFGGGGGGGVHVA